MVNIMTGAISLLSLREAAKRVNKALAAVGKRQGGYGMLTVLLYCIFYYFGNLNRGQTSLKAIWNNKYFHYITDYIISHFNVFVKQLLYGV